VNPNQTQGAVAAPPGQPGSVAPPPPRPPRPLTNFAR